MPTAAEIEALYSRYSYDASDLQAVPPFVAAILDEVIRGFEVYRKVGRLLDVGFGAGALLRAAAAQGWEAHGIETSRLAVEKARANSFTHVIHGDFLTAPYPADHFDIVVLDGVIEHLPDPGSFLRQAFRLLRGGGLLYATAPHGHGISARILGSKWSVCAPPEHLHLFSTRSAKLSLLAAGFDNVRISTRGFNPYEILDHLRPRPRRDAALPFDRVDSSYRLNEALVGRPAGRLLKRVANRVLGAARLGDTLVMRAAKR